MCASRIIPSLAGGALIAAATALSPALAPTLAQNDMANVRIETVPAAGDVYMLKGRGGNIGLSVGADGAFLIDDQFAPLTDKILAAVAELTDKPVKFVVNTHWHGDHTGGNENLGETGSIIVAHENVRKRMSERQFMEAFDRTVEPSPEAALPVITFDDGVTFHWNDDTIKVVHVPHAHTDGDSIIFFQDANVIHMGDTYFQGQYPFIDIGSGGNIDGVIAAGEMVLERSDAKTKIIPGHGEMSDRDGLRTWIRMLKTSRDAVQRLIDQGMSREQGIAEKPTARFDTEYGQGFINPERFVGSIYDSFTR